MSKGGGDFDVRFPPREAVAKALADMADRIRDGQLDVNQMMMFSEGTRKFDFVLRGVVASGLALEDGRRP